MSRTIRAHTAESHSHEAARGVLVKETGCRIGAPGAGGGRQGPGVSWEQSIRLGGWTVVMAAQTARFQRVDIHTMMKV